MTDQPRPADDRDNVPLTPPPAGAPGATHATPSAAPGASAPGGGVQPDATPGYPGAQPGYPGAQPGYPGGQLGYPGAQGVAPASPLKRPGTVLAALIIEWISIAIVLIASILGAVGLAAVSSEVAGNPEAEAAVGVASLMLVVLLVIVIAQAIVLIFVGKGKNWARITLSVLIAVGIVLDLVTMNPTIGDALGVLVIVLLWLPASTAWFRAKSSA